jgi:hypothetical protein
VRLPPVLLCATATPSTCVTPTIGGTTPMEAANPTSRLCIVSTVYEYRI